MILTETIFLGGAPVGVVLQDTNTRQIAFSPIKGQSPLSAKDWESMDELKVAVLNAYKKESSLNQRAFLSFGEEFQSDHERSN